MDYIIIVCTKVDHVERRQIIRSTWGNVTPYQNVQLGFLVGIPENSSSALVKAVEEESRLHKDIVQTAHLDTYRNLSLKSTAMLDFLTKNCSNVRFHVKIDDDVYVRIPLMTRFLGSGLMQTDTIYGFTLPDSPVARENWSKYYVPYENYPHEYWPNYVNGPAYMMTGDAVPKLFEAILDSPNVLECEDALLTGIAAEKAEVRLVHTPILMGDNFQPVVNETLYGYEPSRAFHLVSSPVVQTTLWEKDNNASDGNSINLRFIQQENQLLGI